MLVSCLLLTYNRFNLFKQAVECYNKQTYENKELVVVCDGSDEYKNQVKDFLDGLKNLKFVDLKKGLSLGELRNKSVEAASGEIVCQWDDDELNHPTRISKQIELMGDSPACCFTEQLRWVEPINKIFRLRSNGPIVGTLMAKREVLIENRYQALKRGEDSVLVEELIKKKLFSVVKNDSWLHIYRYHGDNTWDLNHQLNMIRLLGTKIPPELRNDIKREWPNLEQYIANPEDIRPPDKNLGLRKTEIAVASEIIVQMIDDVNNILYRLRDGMRVGFPASTHGERIHPPISPGAVKYALGEENFRKMEMILSILDAE